MPEPASSAFLAPIQGFEDHLRDASSFKGHAERIALPVSEEEVVQVLTQAQREKRPVTISGAGTGLTGARVPMEGWVLCTERMNRILAIEWDSSSGEGTATVEPGVTLKQLEAALEERGLFYPPDPGEKAASVGGTISTNASGPCSLKYGPTRWFVRRLRVVLPSGELLELRRGELRPVEGEFHLRTGGGASVHLPLPTYSFAHLKKNSAGYYCAPSMDLLDLFVGAEGTLGVVTQVELRVLKKPQALLSGMLFFDSEEACFHFARQITAATSLSGEHAPTLSPRAMEFFDSRSLTLLAQRHPDTPQEAKAALLFEQECAPEQVEPLRQEWARRAEAAGARPSDCWYSHRPEDHRLFRQYRYDLPVMVNELVARSGFRKLGTDLAVPSEQAEEMFRFYQATLPQAGIEYLLWGHIGDHHLHVNLLPKSDDEFGRAQELYAHLARKAIALGGTVSGEHGIGKTRIPYLEMMVGPEGLRQMARIKKALDPNGLLCPGNIFPAELLNEV